MLKQPGCVAQLVAHLTEEQEISGLIPVVAHIFIGIDHEIFSAVIFGPFHIFRKASVQLLAKVWALSIC